MLVFTHTDVPGIIGSPSAQSLASHGVNIAQMAVGRAAPGGDAIGVLNLDARALGRRARREVRSGTIRSAQRVRVVNLPGAGDDARRGSHRLTKASPRHPREILAELGL